MEESRAGIGRAASQMRSKTGWTDGTIVTGNWTPSMRARLPDHDYHRWAVPQGCGRTDAAGQMRGWAQQGVGCSEFPQGTGRLSATDPSKADLNSSAPAGPKGTKAARGHAAAATRAASGHLAKATVSVPTAAGRHRPRHTGGHATHSPAPKASGEAAPGAACLPGPAPRRPASRSPSAAFAPAGSAGQRRRAHR